MRPMKIKVIKRNEIPAVEGESFVRPERPAEVVERWVDDSRRKAEADRRKSMRTLFGTPLGTEN